MQAHDRWGFLAWGCFLEGGWGSFAVDDELMMMLLMMWCGGGGVAMMGVMGVMGGVMMWVMW